MALTIGERWVNPRTGTSMEVIAPNEVRRVIKPGNGRLQAHYQLDYVERFVVESGRAIVRHNGRKVELAPGDELVVQPRESHVNPYNRGTGDLVFRQSVEPLVPFVEGFVKTYGACLAADRTDRQDEVPLLAIFGVANLVESPSYAAGFPRWLQRRLAAPVGAALARIRGYPIAV
jgi:mannose-6-phosphate isomerase-like protein (cupin superfamily)